MFSEILNQDFRNHHFFWFSLTPREFNSYGSRRGNDAVMARGTFANIRLINKFLKKPGPRTLYLPTGEEVLPYLFSIKWPFLSFKTIPKILICLIRQIKIFGIVLKRKNLSQKLNFIRLIQIFRVILEIRKNNTVL